MTSGIHAMIDAVATCSRCGNSPASGLCACWLKLRCPTCDRSSLVTRVAIDPPSATELLYKCPGCRADPAEEPVYVDRLGVRVPL